MHRQIFDNDVRRALSKRRGPFSMFLFKLNTFLSGACEFEVDTFEYQLLQAFGASLWAAAPLERLSDRNKSGLLLSSC
jgi:hypothetical protein